MGWVQIALEKSAGTVIVKWSSLRIDSDDSGDSFTARFAREAKERRRGSAARSRATDRLP